MSVKAFAPWFVFILGLPGLVFGDLIYVAATSDDGGNGQSWEFAYNDLQSALNNCSPNDTIWVAEGIYRPGNDREDHFTLVDSVVMLGGFRGDESNHIQRDPRTYITKLCGNIGDSLDVTDNAFHVVYVHSETFLSPVTQLDGFHISNGYANGDFSSGWGGGLFIGSGSPIIRDCTFENNSAIHGGAIHVDSDSALFKQVTIKDNYAFQGGGGVNLQGNVGTRFLDSSFDNNTSQRYGGAIAIDLASATFMRCEFIFNRAIEDNGGAISNYTFAHPLLINCSLYGNTAMQGGSIWSGGADVTIINSILWNNQPTEIFGGFEVSVLHSDIQGGAAGEANIAADPEFLNPSLGDLQLASASPCVDAGIDVYVRDGDTLIYLLPTDYHGLAPDMGANESPYTSSNVDAQPMLPSDLHMHQNHPNPFNPATRIRYWVPDKALVSLIIYDLLGNEVTRLFENIKLPGSYEIQWDGHDSDGKPVVSGVYVARLQSGDITHSMKLTCLQ